MNDYIKRIATSAIMAVSLWLGLDFLRDHFSHAVAWIVCGFVIGLALGYQVGFGFGAANAITKKVIRDLAKEKGNQS